MRHAPLAPPRHSIDLGASSAIDAVAAAEAPGRRFLTSRWFAAAATVRHTAVARGPDGSPRIAIPLAARNRLLGEVPGSYWPFRSFPIAADCTADELVALLRAPDARRALGPAWRIGPIEADDRALALLRAAAPAAGWTVIERRIADAFILDMPAARAAEGGWPRASTLKKNRFHEKHLASHGALAWSFHRGDALTPALFDQLAAIERLSWVGTDTDGKDAKFAAPHHRALWARLAADPAQAARINVALLTIDGAPAAFAFDLDCAPVRYAIANSYDPAFAKHSPGKCLAYRNLQDAAARGIERVDWGAGDSGYKTTLGAVAGPALVDCLVLRGPALRLAARLGLSRLWARTGRG